jgi:hypothetical protein
MTDATLKQAFRNLARTMTSNEPRTWNWQGPRACDRAYHLTEQLAQSYIEQHGGVAWQRTSK